LEITFFFAVFYCGAVSAQNDSSVCSTENRWALIVIAGTSPNENVHQSEKPIEKSLQEGLIHAGYLKEHIIVLTPKRPEPLAKPTQKNIREQLQWIRNPENKGTLSGQNPIRQLDEACEIFVYIQMLGIKNNQDQNQYLCPVTADGKPVSPQNTDNLLLVSEISETLAQSTVERRLLVMNILSPIVIRGSAQETLDGIDSQTLIREVPIPTIRSGFGQIIVNDQISAGTETIDSFADIFLRGLSGYADHSLQGNHDQSVTLNELSEYLEYYGNMANAGSVTTMLAGHDYPISAGTDVVPKSVLEIDTKEILKQVGQTLMEIKTSRNGIPDYESASESFVRAAALAGTNNVIVNVSRGTLIYSEKNSRSGKQIKSSDSLRLLKYDGGWFHVESGWIKPVNVVSLNVIEK
jgi:hypothetical protein